MNTKLRIALTAVAFIALTETAQTYCGEIGGRPCGDPYDYDRMVRDQAHEQRMKELNNDILKSRCLTMKFTYRDLGSLRLDSATIKMIDTDIAKCRAAGLW